MAKNRYNPTPDYQPKSERQQKAVVEESSIAPTPCIVCQKMTQGYGLWESGSTCSRECEALQEAQPKLHGGQSCLKEP